MQKVGKPKQLKGKCPSCGNKFIATADDFFMTKNSIWRNLTPMIKCPYCKTFLYKAMGFFGGIIWERPDWGFEVVKEEK